MIEFHGPFSNTHYRVTLDGYLVPNLELGHKDGDWFLFLDGRWGTEALTRQELERWIPMLAHIQAIGAGYACHGSEEKHNPFRVKMTCITAIATGDDGPPKAKLSLVPASPPNSDPTEKP